MEFVIKEEDVSQIVEQSLFWVFRKPDIHKYTCTSLFDNTVCDIVAATSQSGTSCEAMKNYNYSGYFGQHQIILFSLVGVVKKNLSTHICSWDPFWFLWKGTVKFVKQSIDLECDWILWIWIKVLTLNVTKYCEHE